MSIRKRSLVKAGVMIASTVVAAAPLGSAPSAAATSSVKGYSEDPTGFGSLVRCQNVFTGPVTGDDGGGPIVARIDGVTFNFCQAGATVSPNALPWTLNLHQAGYTIEGFDVDITTSGGTCRYTGMVHGVAQFPGVYDLRGLLTRRNSGCGGPAQLRISNSIEVIGTTG